MNRRSFMRTTAIGAAGTVLSSSSAINCKAGTRMTAGDLNAYLKSIIEVDEPSVDRIVIGDPNTAVSRIGTAWMPYWKTLRKAVDAGVNALVVHEPAFYTHWDLDAEKDDYLRAPSPEELTTQFVPGSKPLTQRTRVNL
jgi:hypothetical protein